VQYNSDDLGRLELNTGRYTVQRLKNPVDGRSMEPQRVSLGENGRVFVSTTEEALVSVQDGRVRLLSENPSSFTLSVNRSGRWGISTDPGGELYDLRRGQTRNLRERQTPELRVAAFLADGQRAVSLNEDESFTEWNLETAQPIRRFGNTDGISRSADYTHLRVSRDGRFFVSGRKNGRLTLWDARTGKRLTDWRELEDETYDECCYGAMYDLQFSPDGRYVVAGTDRGAALFDTTSRRAVARFDLNGLTGTAFAFHPVTARLYVATSDGSIRQYARK
jgi:WD40 repeat protein